MFKRIGGEIYSRTAGLATETCYILWTAPSLQLIKKSVLNSWILDLVATTRTNERAAEALKTDKAAWKRNMIRTAILLAHPVKG